MSFKPAKRFILGAVYAVVTDGWVWPAVCVSNEMEDDTSHAYLAGLGEYRNLSGWYVKDAREAGVEFYRIRARDWDSFEPEMTEFEKSLPFGYPGARAAYPDCTCSLGNTIEARRHYEMCALKEGK